MSKHVLNEQEVPTNWSRRRAIRLNGRFLKGPIPIRQIAAAAKLPGQSLAVFLAIHHQKALTRRDSVTLPKELLAQLGVSRDAKARALQALETAGMAHVERSSGRAARVRLVPETVEAESAPTDPIWRNDHWTITEEGLSSRQQQYRISVEQLTELRPVKGYTGIATWPLQMADKSWVDLEAFIEAFQQALEFHKPSGRDALDLDQSIKLARIEAARKNRHAQINRTPDSA